MRGAGLRVRDGPAAGEPAAAAAPGGGQAVDKPPERQVQPSLPILSCLARAVNCYLCVSKCFGQCEMFSRCVREKIQMAYERVDAVAMYLFPAIFFFFNLFYWTYYLIAVNLFDLSLF